MQVCEANHRANRLVCSLCASELRQVRAVQKWQGLRYVLKVWGCDCFFVVMFTFLYLLITFLHLVPEPSAPAAKFCAQGELQRQLRLIAPSKYSIPLRTLIFGGSMADSQCCPFRALLRPIAFGSLVASVSPPSCAVLTANRFWT